MNDWKTCLEPGLQTQEQHDINSSGNRAQETLRLTMDGPYCLEMSKQLEFIQQCGFVISMLHATGRLAVNADIRGIFLGCEIYWREACGSHILRSYPVTVFFMCIERERL